MNDLVTIAERLRCSGDSAQADDIALSDGQAALSYSQLIRKVTELASWIQSLQPQLVAIHAQNSIDWVVLDLACQQAEVKCLPLPDFFSLSQLEHCIEQSRVDLLFTNSAALLAHLSLVGTALTPIDSIVAIDSVRIKRPTKAENCAEICPVGTQKITFTSGSTGTPKGVCLSANHQWQTATAIADAIHLDNPRHLCLLPLATLLENVAGVYAPLLCHGTVIVPGDAERGLSGSSGLDIPIFLECINSYQPDTIILLPQLLSVLVAACKQGWEPPATLKFIAVGGARVAPDLLAVAHQLGLPVYEGYGLSECGSVVALNTPLHSNPGFAGRGLGHCTISLIDNEIVVKDSVFLGYLNDLDSWYPKQVNTGDLGFLQDNFLLVNGRKKNLIISSYGRNISPEWVESELSAKPLLSHCVVVGDGQPHLAALLSAAAQVSDSSIDAWVSEVNARLPDYAQVKTWKRLSHDDWQGCITANGRPQRQKINQAMAAVIAGLYLQIPERHQSKQPTTSFLETTQS